MTKILLNKFALLCALYVLPTVVWSQGIILYMKDGSKSVFPYEAIDSIVTYNTPYATDATEYEIPVVFHVFYSSQNIPTEYVREGHLANVLDAVNRRFANCGVDLKLRFKMAEVDPEGNVLTEPGVDRQKLKIATLNSSDFLNNVDFTLRSATEGTKQAETFMWDPTKYLNICLFREKNDGKKLFRAEEIMARYE